MSSAIPRMRMFAGPNGSGKSTIKGVIGPELLGVYINPDEIEKDIATFGFLDLLSYGVETTADEVLPFFQQSPFLEKAQQRGFRTYLYYIATEAPEINISRVENRVKAGGHPVPKEKIVERYHRSLELLADAVRYTDRAYIFDNSFHEKVWIAEITGGNELEMKTDTMPHWFKIALWDKFAANLEE